MSKVWFQESIEPFFSNTHFDLTWPSAAFAFIPSAARLQLLGTEFIRVVSLDLELVDDHLAKVLNERCQHLREPHLLLDYGRLDLLPIYPVEHSENDWTDEDRHNCVKDLPIREIYRLQKVTLSINSPLHGEYGPLDEGFLRNILLMEDVLQQWLTSPNQGTPVL